MAKKLASNLTTSKQARSLAKKLLASPNPKWLEQSCASPILVHELTLILIECYKVLVPHLLNSRQTRAKMLTLLSAKANSPKNTDSILGRLRDVVSETDWLSEILNDETRHALDTLRSLGEITAILVSLGETESRKDVDRLVLRSISLGVSVGCYRMSIKQGDAVESYQQGAETRTKNSKVRTEKAIEKNAFAKAEYDRRIAGEKERKMKTATLKNMSMEKGADGKPKYGSYRTLMSYSKTW